MRAAIYQHLTANCVSIPTWRQPYTADANTPKPYGVIKLGTVMQSLNSRGSFREVQIWPYVGGSSFVALDTAVKEIRTLLDGKQLVTANGKRFELKWVHEDDDYRDPDLNALTRRIDFQVPLVGLL